MKFVTYPADLDASTAEYSGNAEFQKGFFDRFKYFAAGLTRKNKGDRAAAAVAIQLTARNLNCTIAFDRDKETGAIVQVTIASGLNPGPC